MLWLIGTSSTSLLSSTLYLNTTLVMVNLEQYKEDGFDSVFKYNSCYG
ncbi:MAG: hypothetical protein ACRCYE_13805 [Sarcina sp.]